MGETQEEAVITKQVHKACNYYVHTDIITCSTGEAVTPKQVNKVCRCYVQVDVLEIQQHRKPEGGF